MPRKKTMGDIYADTTIHGRGGAVSTLRLLVDTGSSYTWVPSAVLSSLGIAPIAGLSFELANGRVVRRPIAEVRVSILGRTATRWIVFGRKRDAGLVGTDTLQGLLLDVDPTAHRLLPRRRAMAVSPRAVGWTKPPRRSRRRG